MNTKLHKFFKNVQYVEHYLIFYAVSNARRRDEIIRCNLTVNGSNRTLHSGLPIASSPDWLVALKNARNWKAEGKVVDRES